MTTNLRTRGLVIGILALGFGGVAYLAATGDARPAGSSHVDDEINSLTTAVSQATNLEERALLQEKLNTVENERREEVDANDQASQPGYNDAVAAKAKALTRESNAPPTHLPWTPAGSGNIVEGADPVVSKDLKIENDWFMEIGQGRLQVVYAGSRREDPGQGVLVVNTEGSELRTVAVIDTPERHGAVRVTGADRTQLVLTADDGFVFRFEVATLTFQR